jgi:hypothetical protein
MITRHGPSGHWPPLKNEIFDQWAAEVQTLQRHWVHREWVMKKQEAEDSIWDWSCFMD